LLEFKIKKAPQWGAFYYLYFIHLKKICESTLIRSFLFFIYLLVMT
jgi:hypothetical protein